MGKSHSAKPSKKIKRGKVSRRDMKRALKDDVLPGENERQAKKHVRPEDILSTHIYPH